MAQSSFQHVYSFCLRIALKVKISSLCRAKTYPGIILSSWSRSFIQLLEIRKTGSMILRLRENNTCTAFPLLWQYSEVWDPFQHMYYHHYAAPPQKNSYIKGVVNAIVSHLWWICNQSPPGGLGVGKSWRNSSLSLFLHDSHSDRWGQLFIFPWVCSFPKATLLISIILLWHGFHAIHSADIYWGPNMCHVLW